MLAAALLMSGCSSTRVTRMDAQTGKVKSRTQHLVLPNIFSGNLGGDIVQADPDSRQFHTLTTKDGTFIYRTYDASLRKVAEHKVSISPGLRAGYSTQYVVRNEKVAYADTKARRIVAYDMATQTEKILPVPAHVPFKSRSFGSLTNPLQWISDSEILHLEGNAAYVVNVKTGKWRTINNLVKQDMLRYALSPDDTKLALVDGKHGSGSTPCVASIKMLDIGKGTIAQAAGKLTPECASGLKWSSDSKEFAYVAKGAQSDEIRVFNLASGKTRTLRTFPDPGSCSIESFHNGIVGYTIWCDYDTNFLVEMFGRKPFYFIDSQTGETLREIRLRGYRLNPIHPLDNDGKYVTDTTFIGADLAIPIFALKTLRKLMGY